MVERLRRRALKENRFDDASDVVINKRMDVFQKETRPVLDMYPPELVVRIDATMSQIRVLGEIVKVLIPLKEAMDRENDAGHGGTCNCPAAGEISSKISAISSPPDKIFDCRCLGAGAPATQKQFYRGFRG